LNIPSAVHLPDCPPTFEPDDPDVPVEFDPDAVVVWLGTADDTTATLDVLVVTDVGWAATLVVATILLVTNPAVELDTGTTDEVATLVEELATPTLDDAPEPELEFEAPVAPQPAPVGVK
jgi:hypothetical protein